MTWTYYKETLPDGRWLLYRAASGRKSESYFVRSGWNESDLLFHRRSKGDIDSSDIISEEEAERLIASLPEPARDHA